MGWCEEFNIRGGGKNNNFRFETYDIRLIFQRKWKLIFKTYSYLEQIGTDCGSKFDVVLPYIKPQNIFILTLVVRGLQPGIEIITKKL